MTDFWNQKEPGFLYEIYGRNATLHDNFQRWIWHKPFDTVLEVGCGVGIYAELLKDKGKAYTGIDIHEKLIEWLNREYFADFYLGDFLTTPIKGTFDMVFSHNTIEHVPSPNAFLEKMIQLSDKYIYLAAHTGLYRTLRHHKVVKTKEEYYLNKISVLKCQTMLEDAGFQVTVDYFKYHGKYSPGLIIKAVKNQD